MIDDTLKAIIDKYPQVKPHLKGYAAVLAYDIKTGEAPDDDLRRKDERRLQRLIQTFLDEQLERIIEAARSVPRV
jgi:Fe-S-cluster formation regulator IscX/YfhJ